MNPHANWLTTLGNPAMVVLIVVAKLTLLLAAAWIAHKALARTNPRWRVLVWRLAAAGCVVVAVLGVCPPLFQWAVLPADRAGGQVDAASADRQVGAQAPPSFTQDSTATAPRTSDPSAIVSFNREPTAIAALNHQQTATAALSEETAATEPSSIHFSAATHSAITPSPSPRANSPSWLTWMLAIWLTGLLLVGGRTAIGLARLRGIRRRAASVLHWVKDESTVIAHKLGCTNPPGTGSICGSRWSKLCLSPPRSLDVTILQTSELTTPCLIGLFRPVLLLPARQCIPEHRADLPAILAHELAHVSNGDLAWNAALSALTHALWFHPFAWRIRPAHAAACDAVSDATAADCLGDASAYGRTLARLALHIASPVTTPGLAMARTSNVRQRIDALRRRSYCSAFPYKRCAVAKAGMLLAVMVLATTTLTRADDDSKSQSSAASVPLEGQAPSAKPMLQDQNVAKKSDARAAPTDVPEDHATTSGTMLIQVVGPDGNPLQGAHIHASIWSKLPFPGNSQYVTDEKGLALVSLPRALRILRVWARYEGRVPLFAQWWPEEQKDGHEIPEVFVFNLQQGTQIGGLVQNEEGKPIAGVTVEVMRESGGMTEELATRPVLDTWLAEGDGPDGALTTDAEGRWQLNNVPAGDDVKVRVKLSHPDYVDDETWGGLQRAQHISMKEFRDQTATIVMQHSIPVSGKVTDSDGKPVEAAVVVWGRDPYSQEGSQEVLTDENGDYRFPALPPREETITVVARDWMPELRQITIAHDMQPVNFRMKSGKTLRIRFVDNAGQPIPGVGVGLGEWRGGKSLYNHQHPNVIYTGIPGMSDGKGIYEWTWAPDDPIELYFWHEGFDTITTHLTAGSGEHLQVLHPALRIRGRVTDAATGKPVEQFTIVPLAIYSEGVVRAHRPGTEHRGGEYTFTFNDKNRTSYRLQIEAIGYRTAISEILEIGSLKPTCDFLLEPAPPEMGRVVSKDGAPVAGAKVFLANRTQSAGNFLSDDAETNFRTITGIQGEFSFPAQLGPYTLVVIHDSGCAEQAVAWNEHPGEIKLNDWAAVTGVYYHDGEPVPLIPISLYDIRVHSETSPVIDTHIIAETDGNGRFTFRHVVPGKYHLRPYYTVGWENSRQAVPLELVTGQKLDVDLGMGARVTGRLSLVGQALSDWSPEHSEHYLYRRQDGIEPPAEVAALGYDWRQGWNEEWYYTGRQYLETLHHYTVQTQHDGKFVVDGVPAGEYDVALRVFAPPGNGVNLIPIATRVIRFAVSEADVQRGTLDLGDVEIEASLVDIRPGTAVPDFSFQTLDAGSQQISDLRGRHVLLHFWESARVRGNEMLPSIKQLYDEHASSERLVILGLSFDSNLETLHQFVEGQKLPWRQGFLGPGYASDVPARLGIYNLPLNLLVSPEGTLVHKGESVEELRNAIEDIPK